MLTKETNKIGSAYYSLPETKASTTNKMLPIGREGKRKGFETETHEVLSAIGSTYCSLKTLDKHHKQNRECLLLTTETRQAPLTT